MAALIPFLVSARGRLRSRRSHSRPDMTPMVDLAFVLLTFFLMAARSPVLQLTMPAERDAYSNSAFYEGWHNGAITLILGANHQLHYYAGLNSPNDPTVSRPELLTTDFGPQGIRRILLAWRQQLNKPVILIKPGPQATYRDLVDILDEMNITDQSRYMLLTLTPDDRQQLHRAGY